jgi:pyruvate-formate lyase-activating enzyme
MFVLGPPVRSSYGASPFEREEVLGTAFHREIVRVTLGRMPSGFLSLRHKVSRRLVHKGLHFFLGRNAPGRILNFLVYLVQRKRAAQVRYMPPLLFFDAAASCNLRCPGCATGLRLTRPAAKASRETMHSVIDQVCTSAAQLAFYHWGEAFLNDDVFEAIGYARSKGLWTVVSSHLSLKRPRLAERIVESGLHDLIVSCDGASQDVYQQYRKGGDIEVVWANLRAIRAHRDRLRQRTPFLRAKMIVFEHNWHEAGRFEAMARANGADDVQFAFGNGDKMFQDGIIGSGSQFDVVDLSWKEKKPSGACEDIWQAMYVTPDGGALSCCLGHTNRDLFVQPSPGVDVRRMWNSHAYVAARRYFLGKVDAASTPAPCQSCLYVTRFNSSD